MPKIEFLTRRTFECSKDPRNPVARCNWDPGPWTDEDDFYEWRDQKTGYPCLMVRHVELGFLCGYAGIPSNHKLYRKKWTNRNFPELGFRIDYSAPCGHIICHVPREGESDRVWWLGFSCSHLDDFIPSSAFLMKHLGHTEFATCPEWKSYKTAAMVARKVTAMAAVLKDYH